MAAKKKYKANPNNEFRPRITSITLGGFQVFDEPTTIPLAPLTFLFGPNSAGKSAVEDALLLLNEALKSPRRIHPGEKSYDVDPWDRFARLRSHWRRTDGSETSFSPVLVLGIGADLPTDLAGVLQTTSDDLKRRHKRFTFGHEAKVLLKYQLQFDEVGQHSAARDIHLYIDGRELLRLEENVRFGLCLDHPVLRKTPFITRYKQFVQLPDVVTIEGGWMWLEIEGSKIDANLELDRHLLQVALLNATTSRNSDSKNLVSSSSVSITLEKIQSLTELTEFCDLFDLIYQTVIGNISIRPDLVHASRTIPTPQQLTFWVKPDVECANEDALWPDVSQFGNEQGEYFDLAASFVEAKLNSSGPSLGPREKLSKLSMGVNRALTDHLFLERGYRIESTLRVLLDVEHDLDSVSFYHANIPILVRMFLVDSQGRRFSFDEVGSGLGYVLPVLCSISHPEITVSLLQQPELHLHPALQAALGDVLIEASHLGDQSDVLLDDIEEHKQLIIETHSEHLLLRVLKRIRQTGTSNPPPPELQLQPEDLCVVYFDPTPDGITRVKRLRVSPDGDFLDLWPRGFFVERDQELFDE
jgi:hypothetical protein